jgi:hypothetical protein
MQFGKNSKLGNLGYFIVHDVSMMWRPHDSDVEEVAWTSMVTVAIGSMGASDVGIACRSGMAKLQTIVAWVEGGFSLRPYTTRHHKDCAT